MESFEREFTYYIDGGLSSTVTASNPREAALKVACNFPTQIISSNRGEAEENSREIRLYDRDINMCFAFQSFVWLPSDNDDIEARVVKKRIGVFDPTRIFTNIYNRN